MQLIPQLIRGYKKDVNVDKKTAKVTIKTLVKNFTRKKKEKEDY